VFREYTPTTGLSPASGVVSSTVTKLDWEQLHVFAASDMKFEPLETRNYRARFLKMFVNLCTTNQHRRVISISISPEPGDETPTESSSTQTS
jgi:hypothetical protein